MRKLDTYRLIFAILVSALFFAPADLSAQSETSGTSAKIDSIIEYLTPLEYAFMMHEETKFMIRLPAFGMGAELEAFPYFTFMGEAYFQTDGRYLYSELNVTAQARWYYGSRKKKVRNMSGNYIALGFDDKAANTSRLDFWRFYARLGMQRRFLNYGLIDLGINTGYGKLDARLALWGLESLGDGYFIQSHAQVGLGFVFSKLKSLDKELLCPVLKCYQKETFILKINTNDLFSINYIPNGDRTEFRIQPKEAIEQKRFNVPISIGADFKFDYNRWNNTRTFLLKENSSGYSGKIAGRIHTRYYYNLKRRIIKGNSGDGFSANYISAGVFQNHYFSGYGPGNFENPITGYIFTTGIQRTFSDHYYFDVEAGIQQDPYLQEYNSPMFYAEIQLGIKF